MTLEDVEDIEQLRRAALLLEAENQKMSRLISRLQKRLNQLEGKEAEQLTLQIAELEQHLGVMRGRMFGDSSEKRPRAKKKATEEPAEQTGHGPRPQPELPVIEQVHVADEVDKVCDACGGDLETWDGQFEESDEVDVLERRFVMKRIKRQKYRCRCGQCIETAPGPTKLQPGGRYSKDFAVHVAVSKYADHLPLERQVKIMKREGLIIDSQTLWDQLNALARVVEPVHDKLHAHVLSQPVIGADETYWRLLGAKGKKKGGVGKRWQTWAVICPEAGSYRILDSRSADAAKQVLGGYAGVTLCDGYSAYQSLQKQGGKFVLAHCWAHVRRKFVETEDQYPAQCGEVLEMIGKLYGIERDCTGPPEERLALRREKSAAIIKDIHTWALETEALPQSSLGRAIAYMGGIWEGLKVFLENPGVELDNNRTERALRGVVLGRKNHLGSRSKRGTEVSALFYSLIESAKLCGVGPHTYLKAAADAALRRNAMPLPHELA